MDWTETFVIIVPMFSFLAFIYRQVKELRDEMKVEIKRLDDKITATNLRMEQIHKDLQEDIRIKTQKLEEDIRNNTRKLEEDIRNNNRKLEEEIRAQTLRVDLQSQRADQLYQTLNQTLAQLLERFPAPKTNP